MQTKNHISCFQATSNYESRSPWLLQGAAPKPSTAWPQHGTGPSPLNRKQGQGWTLYYLLGQKLWEECSEYLRCHKLGTPTWLTGGAGEKEDMVGDKYREWNTQPSMLSPPWQRHKKKLLFWNIFKNCGDKSRHRETKPTMPLFIRVLWAIIPIQHWWDRRRPHRAVLKKLRQPLYFIHKCQYKKFIT